MRDFNFENDVRAARLLLEAGVPIVLAGFELTRQVAVTLADLETIRRADTDIAAHRYRNSLAWCRYWTHNFPTDAGFHPWDSAAIAWLRHPEYFVTERCGWQIREAGSSMNAQPAHSNAGSPTAWWLECDLAFPGNRLTYCTGFAPGARRAFVRDIVTNVY